MQSVKSASRRLFITVLFLGALMTTLQVISGLGFKDVKAWFEGSTTSPVIEQPKMNSHFHKKKSPVQAVANQIYDGKTETSISESVNWEQYPSQIVTATGYTAGKESTGKTPEHPEYGITFSGVKVTRNAFSTIAADPSVFPIGSILYIPNYGYGVVADTGSAIKGKTIDLYYRTVDDVYDKWGKKKVKVYMLKKGKGQLTQKTMKRLNNQEPQEVYRQLVSQEST